MRDSLLDLGVAASDAQKDLLDAETDYINEVIDYRLQVARIEALVGGPLD